MAKTLVAFLLDETGSMMSRKQETIDGFNEYVDSLGEKGKKIFLTLTTFNSLGVNVRCKGVGLKEVERLSSETYKPDMLTPLYDAIGDTVRETEKVSDKYKNILFVILTDGQENASQEFSREDIFAKIKEKEADGWQFIYLGTGHDVWAASNLIGISYANTAAYGEQKTSAAFANIVSNSYRASRGMSASYTVEQRSDME